VSGARPSPATTASAGETPAKVFPGSESDPTAAGDGLAEPDPAKPAKVTAGSPSNAAKVFPGSALPPRSVAAPYHDAVVRQDRSQIVDRAHLAGHGHAVLTT
jgi:hypothetical protein